MEQLFASGRVVDVILFIMLAEYLTLRLYLARAEQSAALSSVALYLLSGAFLLLALRISLTGGSWVWIACCLAVAGASHALDLRQRFAAAVKRS